MSDRVAPFDTPITVSGPLRAPRQMLDDQVYDGHKSIHDDATAEKLGFAGAPIEGPTHFSQLEPLAFQLWGAAFYERGCLSAHYRNMVVEGEQVRASITAAPGATHGTIAAFKEDGAEVLTGTATLGPEHGETELTRRRAKLRPHGELVILRDMRVGDRGKRREPVRMAFDQHLGDWYPFTLADKLERITELRDAEAADVEDGGRQGAPGAAHAVHADGSDRVVELHAYRRSARRARPARRPRRRSAPSPAA